MRPLLALVPTISLLAGCSPAVRLAPMPTVASGGWSQRDPSGSAEGIASPLASLLGDPELARLTAQAIAGNPDIAAAAARVERARADLGAARRASLPEISAQTGLNAQFGKRGSSGIDYRQSFAQLDVSWELDLAGRFAAGRRAARGRLESAQWARDAVALAIETEVARAWIQRAALVRRLDIYDRLIARAREMERIVRVRQDAGTATRVELGLQSIRVLDLRRQRSEIAQSLEQTRSALAVLVGAEAPTFTSDPAEFDRFTLPALVPPAPAALLAARPDVRGAEADIAAANGDVAAARASFFPRLTVSASGLAANDPLTRTVTLGSGLLAPIFARGTLGRDLQAAGARQVEAAEVYRRTLLAALAEVETLNATIAGSAERADLVGAIADEARTTARLSNLEYLEGEEDLRFVINAEQLLGEAEEARVLLQQERLFAQIALYSAMGGLPSQAASARAPNTGRGDR
ncbi:efflux transporter outer membrane subunit [Novosphingobium sp.]|uniref:efflux transporter outer membrane subunit n=1 Tax=Novosphingobium sp. TaxID=1874826 RepID=UPI0026264BEC|nr:efflux transporter outer membrane subunit [Novosphingobium sp.]